PLGRCRGGADRSRKDRFSRKVAVRIVRRPGSMAEVVGTGGVGAMMAIRSPRATARPLVESVPAGDARSSATVQATRPSALLILVVINVFRRTWDFRVVDQPILDDFLSHLVHIFLAALLSLAGRDEQNGQLHQGVAICEAVFGDPVDGAIPPIRDPVVALKRSE